MAYNVLIIVESVKVSTGYTGQKIFGNYIYVYEDGKLVATYLKK